MLHLKYSPTPINFLIRGVSSGYFKTRPRLYKRRLYEAALAPILPTNLEREWTKANDPFNIYSASPAAELVEKEFTQYEMALVEKLRSWIISENFRVITFCQLNSTKEETLWLARNQFRMNGIELCDVSCKILRKMLDSTRFRILNSLLIDECTCLLFGKEPECISSVISLSLRYNWIQPLAFTVDSRILSLEHANEFAGADSLNKLRFQTVQILGQILVQLPSAFDNFIGQVPLTLDNHLKVVSK